MPGITSSLLLTICLGDISSAFETQALIITHFWHFPRLRCCIRIAESHQTPQEPRIDAKTVRNFITSSSKDSLHTMAKEPLVKAAKLFFIIYSRGSGTGSLRGVVNSSTKHVFLATDWWVRVRGGVRGFPVLPWLARWVSFSPREGVLLKMAVLS